MDLCCTRADCARRYTILNMTRDFPQWSANYIRRRVPVPCIERQRIVNGRRRADTPFRPWIQRAGRRLSSLRVRPGFSTTGSDQSSLIITETSSSIAPTLVNPLFPSSASTPQVATHTPGASISASVGTPSTLYYPSSSSKSSKKEMAPLCNMLKFPFSS